MPKQVYKILSFHGGINNDADPRDISENQFTELSNVAIDKLGRIVALGDIKTTHHTIAGAITVPGGRGLMAIRTDYDGFADDSPAVGGGTFYVLEKAAGIITEDSATAEAETSYGIANLEEASMYYVDGALRVYDADHSTSVTPYWRGFISAKTYMPQATGGDIAIAASWYSGNAQIEGCFPTITAAESAAFAGVCKNALMLNVSYSASSEQEYGFDNEAVHTYDGAWDGTTDGGTTNSGMNWGFALEFAEHASGVGTGSWMPNTTVRYKFFITTMYDDHTQESPPQLLRMWDTEQIDGGATYSGKVITTELAFRAGDSSGLGKNVAVFFRPVFKVLGTDYNFGAAAIGTEDTGNKRISGCRIYWSSNEDGYSTLWQLFDAKFDEGCRVIGVDGGGGGTLGYSPWGDATDGEHVTVDLDTDNVWTHPPKMISYEMVNGHAKDEVFNVDSFKTSVVANRRVYIGNVEQDGQIYGDRMLKSPVNAFDKFPQDVGQLDVIVQDGDEIVHLAEFADRILQFKKSVLYIINISGAVEYIESEHKFKGVTNPGAVCKTDYGIAWANQNGLYMYDGQQVTDLLENKSIRNISKSTWSTHIGTANYHRVGYNPKKRQIIVIAGADDSTAGYVFDLVTKGFVYGSSIIVDPNTGSNFINDPVGGDLLIFDEAGTIDKWADTPTAAPSITITTKDIDFGEPALNKNVYKVRITYTGGTSQACNIQYAKDGSGSFLEFDANLNYTTNTTQQIVDLTPSAAITNIKSIQLKISGTAATTFELNDISIIFRIKGVR